MTPEERELMTRFPDLVQYMLKTMEQNGETSFEIPWGEKAVERYIGSFVLSLHAYIESFVDSTIDRMIANQDSRTLILEYCDKHLRRRWINFAELEEVDGSKYEVISELVKRNLPLNLPKRMLFICVKLGAGTRGGIDREYKSEAKAYKYTEEHNDLIIGFDKDSFDLYLVPTRFTSRWGKSISKNELGFLKNYWDLLINWNGQFLDTLESKCPD